VEGEQNQESKSTCEADMIANKINEFSKMDKEKISEIGQKGKSYILQKLTYPWLAAKFIDELQK